MSDAAEPSAEKPARRGAKYLLVKYGGGGFIGFIALLLVGLAVLNSSIGQRFIADQIAQVAPASGLRIEVGRIEGDIYGEAVLHDVVLSDPKGKFLTIPLVELDWRPLNWLWSGLDVRNLTARRGNLSRLPELLEGDPDAPILPDFDIRIDRFHIDDLTVAAGIAGDQSQKVNLVAQTDIRSGRVFLKTNGVLGKEDRIYALIDAEPDGDKFDLDFNYQAARNSLLAAMIGTDAPYRARATGKGTWSDWRGSLIIRRDNTQVGAFRLTNEAGQYGIAGMADPAAMLTGLPADALGSSLALVASGTLEDSVLAGDLKMRGRAIRARADGTVDLAGNSFDDFKITARLTDPQLFGESLTLENTRLTATLDGAFRDLSVPHTLNIGQFVSGDTIVSDLQQQGTATYDGTRWVLPLSAEVAKIATGNTMVDPQLVDGSLGGTLTYSGNRLLSDDLAIDFAKANARLALRGDVARGIYALAGPVNLAGLPLQNIGAVNGDAKIVFTYADSLPWKLTADFDGRIPNVSNDTLANLAGQAIAFRGGVTLGGAGPIQFRRVAIGATKLSLLLDGKVDGGTTSVAGSGKHTQYGEFTVQASLADSGPNAVLVFANPLPAAGLKDVRVAIAPTENGFAIDTEGESLLGAFTGQLGLVAPEGGPTRIAINQLNIWKTSVTGALTLADAGISGDLALVGGGLDGTIALAPRGGGQAFDVNLRARNASFGGDTPISIARATIEGSGLFRESDNPLDTRSTITGNVFAEGVSYGSLFLGKLAAKADLTNGAGLVTASLSGRRSSRFDLQLNADLSATRVAVAAQGNYAGRRIRMPRRAVLTKQDEGGWQLDPTQVSYGRGMAIAQGSFGGGGPTAMNVKLADMPLSLVDVVVADLGLGGQISGVVNFSSQAGVIRSGDAKVVVKSLSRSGLVLTSRPVDLALVMDLSASALEARAVVDEDGARLGRVQARITNLPNSDDLIARLQAGNLFAQLRYGGPADALWRLSGVEAFDLTGPISVAADVTGSLADPIARGSIKSTDLRVQSALSGTDVQGISVTGNFSGSRFRLQRFSGTAANGGSVSGSGIIDIRDIGTRGPIIDLRIAAKNAQLLKAAGLNATITGPLRIVSDGATGTIAGRVKVDRASWNLGSAATAEELPQIATRRVNVPADIGPARAASQKWRYLIDATASSRVDVDGLGLDSEWAADIILRGTTSDPRIGGEARVVRGFYSFAGTRFELTRGRIDFDVNVPIDPRVDIIAETESDGIDVEVSVQGNALQPEITFSSTPSLPEEEILSRLLFGGSITELSATDALQLGAALASLRGGGGGLDPIAALRNAIGLDRLRIVSADAALDRGTAVALGKNFGRKFYVEIITDGQGYSATELEYRVTRWLALLASVSTVGRNGVSAEISKDY